MTTLSPAAQAVLDAAEPCVAPFWCPGLEAAIAATLRAAADQLTPYSVADFEGAAMARNKLLAIAAELDPTTTETTDD